MTAEPRSWSFELPGRDVRLAGWDWGGRGPVMLCAHANGFCGRLWELIARELRGEFRVLAYDARGHGDSSAPSAPEAYSWEELAGDLEALVEVLCDELRLERIDYGVGNSMGGTTTLVAASRRPGRFGRIALVDPVILAPEMLTRMARGNEKAEGARRRREIWPSRTAVREVYAQRPLFADWDSEALDLYVEHGFRERADGHVELRCRGEVEAAIFAQAAAFDLFAEARRLRAPGALMLAQRGDFSPEVAQRLVDAAPRLELMPIDTGHLAPMSEPKLLAGLLRAFYAAG